MNRDGGTFFKTTYLKVLNNKRRAKIMSTNNQTTKKATEAQYWLYSKGNEAIRNVKFNYS